MSTIAAVEAAKHGPSVPFCEELHAQKYRLVGESFPDAMNRLALNLNDSEDHREKLLDILLDMRFMPGGRIQTAIGSGKNVTPFSCYVIPVDDSFVDGENSIMDAAKNAAATMRMGGGVGYDFSRLRPRGDMIKKLLSQSSGPVSFMEIFDAVCRCTASSGHRRGAQMGLLRCDHPSIREFIHAKENETKFTGFNISVAVTDELMNAVLSGSTFDLRFGGKVYETVQARDLWEEIMLATWDWAEPGVVFIDQVNRMNNLWYCETLRACNPCQEQPLPDFGACLLGSFNLVKYIQNGRFDFEGFKSDIPAVVRAMDNVIEKAIYPLPQQKIEALNKRRMGLGVTGLANAGECLGMPYGSQRFVAFESVVLHTLMVQAYRASSLLAAEKGEFPLYDAEKYMKGEFIKRLDPATRDMIWANGIRNSHLTSIAPTGTISLCADNVSSSIEPLFDYHFDRTVIEFAGPRTETIQDYGVAAFGVYGKRSQDVTVNEHIDVLVAAQKFVDSSISKTCNISDSVTYDEFKHVYMEAWKRGAKGCSTFRAAGKRRGVLESKSSASCELNADGSKSCE